MGNVPAESDAIQTLLALGPAIVVPYLLNALYDGGQTNTYLWVLASDIRGLLRSHQLDHTYVALCGPMITYHLAYTSNEQKHEAKRLLQVLEKIGPECASYALPTSFHIVLKGTNDELVLQAQRLIESFDKQSLEAYKMLLSDMQEPKGE